MMEVKVTDAKERRGLGRGLSALMADTKASALIGTPSRAGDQTAPVERLSPSPSQPRRRFDEQDLEELANSIREKGIIQPLIVRANPREPGAYEIVAGERRWRAAQRAQLHEVPILVRDLDDAEVLELAIIENIQRTDLNPVEEAMGFQQLMTRFGHTQEKLAEALGKSRSHIANLLRLLQLPEDVLNHLREGRLSAGHARALIPTDDPSTLAGKIIDDGLSVRATEKLVKTLERRPGRPSAPKPEKDADTRALERDLSANLGLKVVLDHKPDQETGTMLIRYESLNQLDMLCQMLSAPPSG
ncbi:MAG: ParB/RepB/Spo0J family partition protein [Pseudomonadota bacterium]